MFYEVLGDEPVSPEKKGAIQEVLEANKVGGNVIFTSVITHLEVIPSKIEAKKPGAEKQYLGTFDGKRFVDLEIGRNILQRAREIREFYYRPPDAAGKGAKVMDAADAVHLATATIYRAHEFHTRDNDDRGTKIPLVTLYQWSGLDKVCNKYPLQIVSPEHKQKVFPFDQSKTETAAEEKAGNGAG
ncbi:hypothetical protein [Bradyrhizobium sp. BWA-3-5]|uniref:type II toxin-antitoxin system VapC family toxin n=1 Tax=Bradyrhizobium sp. BWA-3-5 TaxID=3080013 RepID=UPI00293E7886|nr:hypothetical protein [Bradyrhizobium sp. BWA-3-5]WOH66173.1 hypothetical protein RX331_37625 [Bradyrhizobium sp. BWA-3-5]